MLNEHRPGGMAAGFSLETMLLEPNGWMPNNPHLPVLHYRGVLAADAGRDLAAGLEALFARHGWPPRWRDGIYRLHHYHSTAHEVLGFAAGTARVMLGGPDGVEVGAAAGDVLLLPAGTGHCLLAASADLLVIGAYPPGQEPDLCCPAPSEDMTERVAALPFPASDPVSGAGGPTTREWRLSDLLRCCTNSGHKADRGLSGTRTRG